MPNLGSVLKAEIRRLARSEAKSENKILRKLSSQYRRDIAALKRQVATLKRELQFLRKQEQRRVVSQPPRQSGEDVRFSPKWMQAHRKKLGLSAQQYGKLIGASSLSVYNWEAGKATPRKEKLAGWAAIRKLGKREVLKRLELLDAAA